MDFIPHWGNSLVTAAQKFTLNRNLVGKKQIKYYKRWKNNRSNNKNNMYTIITFYVQTGKINIYRQMRECNINSDQLVWHLAAEEPDICLRRWRRPKQLKGYQILDLSSLDGEKTQKTQMIDSGILVLHFHKVGGAKRQTSRSSMQQWLSYPYTMKPTLPIMQPQNSSLLILTLNFLVRKVRQYMIAQTF